MYKKSMDPIPVRLPAELQARVDQLANKMAISRSAVLRLAVRQWLDAAEHFGTNPMLREEPASYASKSGKAVKAVKTPKGKAGRKGGLGAY